MPWIFHIYHHSDGSSTFLYAIFYTSIEISSYICTFPFKKRYRLSSIYLDIFLSFTENIPNLDHKSFVSFIFSNNNLSNITTKSDELFNLTSDKHSSHFRAFSKDLCALFPRLQKISIFLRENRCLSPSHST